jgi:hypothetical protein
VLSPLGTRLTSLLLRPHPGVRPTTAAGVVSWFGAMQAQDIASVLWSLGSRLPGTTYASISAELEDRATVRTWPMRGTVHLVPSADARWMVELMGPRLLRSAEDRMNALGLTRDVCDRGVEVLRAALSGGNRLARSECMAALSDAGIEAGSQRGYFMLWYASQTAVTAIAPHVGKEQSFVLLDEWAPEPRTPSREEALAKVALWYFRSHGPATVADLARWTALTITDCRAGVAAAGDALTTVDGQILDPALLALDPPDPGRDEWLALAGFDEYMLGYKDRSLFVTPEQFKAVVPGNNGIFQSTLVRAGKVAAVWKRKLTRKAVIVDVTPLVRFTATDRKRAEAALEPFGAFVELPLEVRWPS